VQRIRPDRLVAQDAALSRPKPEFNSPSGHQSIEIDTRRLGQTAGVFYESLAGVLPPLHFDIHPVHDAGNSRARALG
jgi:hypothetical protein